MIAPDPAPAGPRSATPARTEAAGDRRRATRRAATSGPCFGTAAPRHRARAGPAGRGSGSNTAGAPGSFARCPARRHASGAGTRCADRRRGGRGCSRPPPAAGDASIADGDPEVADAVTLPPAATSATPAVRQATPFRRKPVLAAAPVNRPRSVKIGSPRRMAQRLRRGRNLTVLRPRSLCRWYERPNLRPRRHRWPCAVPPAPVGPAAPAGQG